MVKGTLREISEADLEKLLFWRNQDFIRAVMFNDSIINLNQHINWFNSLKNNNQKISKVFTVENKDFGVLNLNNINLQNSSCDWGFYVGEKKSPKGTGLLLGYTSLNYIFFTLNMRKVCGEVLESNLISRNFHEKLGFKLDGILREHVKRNNSYEDVYIYSIFHDEWKECAVNIKKELEERFK